ncbi:hypothetical protein AVEN_115556-1, partial [Araneus ventricosus]
MFSKKTHSFGMVAKPTSRSWDMVDRRYVLISFSLEKLLSEAATDKRAFTTVPLHDFWNTGREKPFVN